MTPSESYRDVFIYFTASRSDESQYCPHRLADTLFYYPCLLEMPPKTETTELIELFKSLGLTQAKAAEAAKNPKGAATLRDIIDKHGLVGKNVEEKQAGLLAALSVAGSKLAEPERTYAVDAICFLTSCNYPKFSCYEVFGSTRVTHRSC